MRARGPAAAQRAAEAALALLARAGRRAVDRLAHTLRAQRTHASTGAPSTRPGVQGLQRGCRCAARAPHCAAPSWCAAGWTQRRIGYLPARRRVRACKASCGASSVDIHVHTRNVHPVRDKVKRVGRHAKAKLHCHAMQPRSNKFARHPAAHARAAPPGTNVAACALSSGQRPDTPSPPLPRPAASV